MEKCPFCNFSEERVLKDTENFLVIFSNPRLMSGHLLIIPKEHINKLSQFSEGQKIELTNLISEFQEKILEKVSSGCDIRINYKPFLENSRTHVNHLHVHLMPREVEDELYKKEEIFRKPLYRDLSKEEKERFRKLLT